MKTSPSMIRRLLAPIAVAAFVSTASAATTTLFDLSSVVRDGNPGENTYFIQLNNSATSLTYESSPTPNLVWNLGNSGNTSSFIGLFDLTELTDVGDSITVTYAFTLSNSFSSNTDTVFRVALFNSGGTQISDDATSGQNALFNNDRGYFVQHIRDNALSEGFRVRIAHNNLWQNNAISGSPATVALGTGLEFAGTFKITLNGANELTISHQINSSPEQSVSITADLVTAFDTIAFHARSGANGATLTFSELNVVYASIPEPSSFAVITGIAGLGIIALRRRR